ncbi:TonB-dependent receptor [Novosphingobium resinovorum]|nr:TonB-dependent receptor [Novosphingobium resinovorum]
MRASIANAVCAFAVLIWSATGAFARNGELNVPALPLARAVASLGQQAGVQILVNAPGSEARRTHAVHGHMTPAEALTRMTRGMGLSVRAVAPGVYLIAKTPPVRKVLQPRPPAPVPEPPEILVSARRRPELERDVPLVVTHLDNSALQHAAVRTLADVARITPGFVATGQTSSATPLLVMRGQRRSISDENRLPLVVYQDEVPLPNQAALSPLFDIASVEVLRGAQGTLFGRNATSGAVLLRSVQPGEGIASYVEGEIGNYGLHRMEAAIELPASGPFSLRVSGQQVRREGYTYMVDGGRADDVHTDAMRAVLRFDPDGPLRSTTSFDMLDAEEKGAALILAGVYPGGSVRDARNAPYFDCGTGACDIDGYFEAQQTLGRRTSQSGLAPSFRRRFRGIGNVTEYGEGDLLVRNIAGLRTTDLHYTLDGDGTPLPINDSITDARLRQWSEELQVQGKHGSLRYIGGLFYLSSAPDGPVVQTLSRLVRPDNPPSHIASYQTFRSAAIFGQVTAALAADLTADLGLRYTGEWIGGCALRSAVARPLSERQCLDDGGTRGKARSRRLTWTLALTRRLGDSSLYATSRRAFRSGGYNTPALGGLLAPFQTFRPETLTDFEVGAKGRWSLGGISGSYAVAAYVGLYDDVQRALFPDVDFDGDGDLTTDPITLYINSAKARVAGADGEFSANLGTRTRLTLSASWIDARYTRIDAPTALTSLLGTDPLHNRFTYTPTFGGSVFLSHDLPLPVGLGTLALGADYAWVSSVRLTERPTESFARQPAYGLLGASITWRRPGGLPVDMELWGRNLTDRFYVSGGGTLNPAYTAATIIPGPPRTIGLRLRYSFE